MANKHCSVKNGKVGRGVKHANYILGQDKFADKGKEQVVFTASENMPNFALENPLDFWAAADQFERANGRVYKEIEFSIPREITEREAQIKFASEFVQATIGQNHPVTLSIHVAIAGDGKPNTHCHAMFSTRENDGIERSAEQYFKRAAAPYRHRVTKEMVEADPSKGGAKKNREMDSKDFVQGVRNTYESQVQKSLFELGHVDQAKAFSMKSNQALGLGEAEPKVGPIHPRSHINRGREMLKATVEVIRNVRAIIAKRPKEPERTETTVEAFLEGNTYKSTDGMEYSILGHVKDGQGVYGRVVGHEKFKEGDYTLIHVGRGFVKLVSGIVAEMGAKVDGILRNNSLEKRAQREQDNGLGR
jgi:hypothetical protein